MRLKGRKGNVPEGGNMKGFFQWFKSSSKMKRWMFLILIGIILACYGLARILVMDVISFETVAQVVAIFVVGFLAIVIGLVFLNKRTLEVLIEASDERMENNKNVNMNSLIFNKTVYDKGPNIVVIGGGTGLNTVLSGLKNYTNNLTAIVTVSDYGEGISNSRKELQTLPLDDIKDSIVSLASKEGEIDKLFNYEFKTGKLKGLNFSDIYFLAMQGANGNFEDSIIKSNEVLNMIGKVIPVTLDEMKIVAELANGYIVEEKSRIPEVVTDKLTKINRITVNPTNCRPAPGVVEAIKNADCIVIGPGSLYTNVIPPLLINGVAKAIKESTAIKVYICNIMTEPGQTDNYSVSEHINAITEHCGTGVFDYCIYDTGEIIPEFIKKYNLEGQDLVEQDVDKVKGIKFLQRNLSMVKDDFIRHDPGLVASSIIELICDDLRYQDKQNDPQYLMLNNKLREEKRINKIKKKTEKKERKIAEGKLGKHDRGLKSKSKFSTKYSDRIASIREADAKAERKKKQRTTKTRNKEIINDAEFDVIRTTRTKSPKEKNTKKRATAKRFADNKSSNAKKKSREEIRNEMLKQLENSKLKDRK